MRFFTLSLLFTVFAVFTACNKDLSPSEQLAKDIEEIKAELKRQNLTATETASGIHYIITAAGSGGSPNSQATITANYKGEFLNGAIFDQTTGTPFTSKLTNLIQGWQEAIPLLQKNGKGRFWIPSALCYGTSGAGPIPPNTPLYFEIELIDFQ